MIVGHKVRHHSQIISTVAHTVRAAHTAPHARSHIRPAIALVFLFATAKGAAYGVQNTEASFDTAEPSIMSIESSTQTSGQPEGTVEVHSSATGLPETIESQASVEVNVNGQDVPINPEGPTHQVITDEGNKTTVDVNIQDGSTTTTTQSSGSTDIRIKSSSQQSFSKTERQ